MDFRQIVDLIVQLRIPELAAFLVALYWILQWTRWIITKLVSNGLTDSIKELKGSVDKLPKEVGDAVALRMLEIIKRAD